MLFTQSIKWLAVWLSGCLCLLAQVRIPGPGGLASGGIPLRAHGKAGVVVPATITIPFPVGSTAGDLCVIYVGSQNQINNPAGWTNNQNNGNAANWSQGAIISKTLSSGDISTGSVTVTTNGGGIILALVAVFIGGHTIRETDVNFNNDTNASHLATASSGVATNDMALIFCASRTSATPTSNVGNLIEGLNNASDAAGSMYGSLRTTGGSFVATCSFTGYNPAGNYVGIIVVEP